MTKQDRSIEDLIRNGENLTLEFKSDKNGLPDRELVAAVVALANTEGGILLLGVEDDGLVTGLHPNHQNVGGIGSLVANKTNPPLSVRVESIKTANGLVAKITVPKSRQLVATSEGLLQRRRMMANGRPEAVPFYPHEFAQRQSAMGLFDPSACPIMDLTAADLNPLERQRIREAIRRYGGDMSILPLADEELDGALGLSVSVDGVRRPTLAGLLMMGRETELRRFIPAYEVAFQVLEGTDVKVNEFSRQPLLYAFEIIEQLFKPWVLENEVQVGLFRVPVPNYDRKAFREALVNALVHRDYARLGAVHVRLDDSGMTVSSPGGFVDGVTLQNLLTTEPKPRNPLLADIVKRIGLAERTGRGIDRIFEGLLRYGRPAPDYTHSDAASVVLRLSNAKADLGFLEMILEQEQHQGRAMPLDSLLILSRLREERRLTTAHIAASVQKSEIETRAAIERLVEAGLIDAHGTGRGRSYTLGAKVYRKLGQKAAGVRQAPFEPIQHEQMVLSYIAKHGSIKRSEVAELCRLSLPQAYHLLNRLKIKGLIQKEGQKRYAVYTRKHES